MEVRQEDLQYLPYNDARLGRIFTVDCKANIKLFIKEFRESDFGSRLVNEGLATGDHLDQILEETQRRFGHDEVNMQEFVATAKSLWMAGDLLPKPSPAAAAAAEAPAERQLSALQRTWQEFRIYTETHSVRECKDRARVDESYRKFLNTNLQREMGNGNHVGDAVVSVGTQAVRQDRTVKITQALNDFAWAYRGMSCEEVRRKSTPATNPDAVSFNQSVADAIAAGLI